MNSDLVWLSVLEEFMGRTPALTRELTLITAVTPTLSDPDFILHASLPSPTEGLQVEVAFHPDQPPSRLALHLSNALLAFRRHCFATATGLAYPALPFSWSAAQDDPANYPQTQASTQNQAVPTTTVAPPQPLSPPPTPAQVALAALERRLYHGVDQAALDAEIDAHLPAQPAPPDAPVNR